MGLAETVLRAQGAPGRHLGIQDGRQYTSARHLGLDGDRKCTGGHLGFQDGGQGRLAPWAQFQQSDFFAYSLFIVLTESVSPLAQVSLQKDLVSSRRLSVASTSEPGEMSAIYHLRFQNGDRTCTGGHLGIQDGGQGRLEQFQQSDFLFIPYLLSSLKVYVNISPGQPRERPGFQQTVECD